MGDDSIAEAASSAPAFDVPRYETDRLVLRGFADADHEPVARFFADPVSALYGGPCEAWEAWRKLAVYVGHWALRGYGPFALEERASGELVGWTGMWYPHGWPEPEITWALLPEHRGRGYASEGARRAIRAAFEDFGWDTAISLIDLRNTASMALAERLGATREAEAPVFGEPGAIYRHRPP